MLVEGDKMFRFGLRGWDIVVAKWHVFRPGAAEVEEVSASALFCRFSAKVAIRFAFCDELLSIVTVQVQLSL